MASIPYLEVSTLETLRWQKFPVLSDGFVCLVDAMGNDAAVVQAARVSYGKDVREDHTAVTEPGIGESKKFAADQRKLLRYMMRHGHTSPFEMVEVKFLVRVPMDTWRQWIRHRTANVNEYSTRYATAIDSRDTTKPDEWRLQSKSNKQGSSGVLEGFPKGEIGGYRHAGQYLSAREAGLHECVKEIYEERLEYGIANEQARKDLPLSTYTEAYWKIDLHNLLHFLEKRMDPAAQKEIRDYANAIAQIVSQLFPLCWEAFVDYRLDSMKLSGLEVVALQQIYWEVGLSASKEQVGKECPWLKERELDEFYTKLQRLTRTPVLTKAKN